MLTGAKWNVAFDTDGASVFDEDEDEAWGCGCGWGCGWGEDRRRTDEGVPPSLSLSLHGSAAVETEVLLEEDANRRPFPVASVGQHGGATAACKNVKPFTPSVASVFNATPGPPRVALALALALTWSLVILVIASGLTPSRASSARKVPVMLPWPSTRDRSLSASKIATALRRSTPDMTQIHVYRYLHTAI